MDSFLYRIAQTFYSQYHSDITGFTFVFPNRRAGLFFQKYLSQIIENPIFSPEIITINECFYSAVPFQQPDNLHLLFTLYELYKSISNSEESFDNFAYWGEMLLSDFEEVDKYDIDAEQLFTNITELKQIDELFNFFTKEQIEAIRQFWSDFVPVPENKIRAGFVTTWKILYPLYKEFRSSLLTENLATEGMISRYVTGKMKRKEEIKEWRDKQFVFIGFNVLTTCEKTLFNELKKQNKADFYWDYESAEVRDSGNRASHFFAENLHHFPSKIEIEPIEYSLHDKDIELISVPSEVGQAKQIYSILDKLYPTDDQKKNWIETAVVLPDENLLIPLLHSLPQQIEKVNVTMGFPLKSTPIAGLLEHIFELHKRKRISGDNNLFYYKTALNILNHPYIAYLCPDKISLLNQRITQYNLVYVDESEFSSHSLLKKIFKSQDNIELFLDYLLAILYQLQIEWKNLSQNNKNNRLDRDFIYQYYVTLNRMNGILKKKPQGLEMNLDTLMRLIRQVMAGISIPFVGEPLDGLQIMGVLEARGLDFENLIITSFNEGIFPKRTISNSFIPYNLRKGFGLPTYEQQEALTAYNFYRLIHRPKRIFFLYDSRTEGVQSGEVSRYAHQLYYHYGVDIKRKTVNFDLTFNTPDILQVNKTPEVVKKLDSFLSENERAKALSASSINSYIDCPLQFYFVRVEEMKEADDLQETIEDNTFGTIFHAAMEYLYESFTGRIIQTDGFDNLLKDSVNIDRKIQKAFSVHYFKKPDEIVRLEGNSLLIARVIRKYVIQMLQTDKKYAPFRYISSEDKRAIRYPIQNGKKSVNIKGFIDRIDEKDGRIRIIDYKTGKGSLEFKNFEDVFDTAKNNRPKYVLQTFLYGLLYKDEAAGKQMTPCIYYVRDIFKKNFESELRYKSEKTSEIISDFSDYEEEFCSHLTQCLEEIFNPEIPFRQTKNTKHCEYCPYKTICNR